MGAAYTWHTRPEVGTRGGGYPVVVVVGTRVVGAGYPVWGQFWDQFGTHFLDQFLTSFETKFALKTG